MAPQSLSGRLALITGAGQGNGRALALGLAKAGARVVVTDMNADTVAKPLQPQINAAGGKAWSLRARRDLAEACKALALTRRRARSDRSTCWSTTPASSFAKARPARTPRPTGRSTIDVNVHGTFNVTLRVAGGDQGHQGLDHQRRLDRRVRRPGRQPGLLALQGRGQDADAVAGAELAPGGVRVNALAPGVIETPMTAATREDPERAGLVHDAHPDGARRADRRPRRSRDLPGLRHVALRHRHHPAVDGGFLAV